MNRWTNIAPLTPFPWLPKGMLSRLANLNTRIEQLVAARAACDAERQALAVEPIDSIDPEQVAPLEVKAARASDRFGLLQLELHLRRDLEAYFVDQTAARRKARSKAETAREELMLTVRQGLVSIGYIESEFPQRGWITPGMVACHPGVADARQLIDELSTEDDSAQRNRDAWETIADELESIRRAAVGSL